MAGAYGRGGVATAKSAAPGSGGSDAYKWAAKNAMDYFSQDEAARYTSESASFSTEGVSSSVRASSRTNLNRLREVAASRALKEWNTAGRSSADPTRRNRMGSLISSEMFGEQMFGSVGHQQATSARESIRGLQGQADRGEALGSSFQSTNQNLTSRLGRQNRYGNTFDMGVKGTVDFGTTYIADPTRAFLGMKGGTNTVYRGGAATESRSSRDLRGQVGSGGGSFHWSNPVQRDERNRIIRGSSAGGRISHSRRSDFDY